MGKRGPKPTPTSVLKMRASWRADTRDGEPRPQCGIPVAPDWLDGKALERFSRLGQQIASMGILSFIDGEKLAAYCVAYETFVDATKFLDENGHWYEGEFGPKRHPASIVQATAMDKLNRLGALFGLSPSDRVGLKVESEQKQEDGKSKYFQA